MRWATPSRARWAWTWWADGRAVARAVVRRPQQRESPGAGDPGPIRPRTDALAGSPGHRPVLARTGGGRRPLARAMERARRRTPGHRRPAGPWQPAGR